MSPNPGLLGPLSRPDAELRNTQEKCKASSAIKHFYSIAGNHDSDTPKPRGFRAKCPFTLSDCDPPVYRWPLWEPVCSTWRWRKGDRGRTLGAPQPTRLPKLRSECTVCSRSHVCAQATVSMCNEVGVDVGRGHDLTGSVLYFRK